ncbi:flagellar hook-basal body complex protein FliE [Photobacterium sanctipauli]|uniref:flagellar hook-basal body complex protein FliE n=1 Tax=Photobacterium sanctipauli TaxID=1342794 RepID=UPI000D1541B8|nr:flagellar hook-basal body complex protein FliE [Photobacterium sanctipauli]
MDQADGLRNLFTKESCKDKLIKTQSEIQRAIITGQYQRLDDLMIELEKAQVAFESTIN